MKQGETNIATARRPSSAGSVDLPADCGFSTGDRPHLRCVHGLLGDVAAEQQQQRFELT
jgi:hypothetical protein